MVAPKLQGEGVWKAFFKMVLAGAAAFGTALLVLPGGHWKEAAAYGLAGAGLSVLIHKGVRLISTLGDEHLTKFLQMFR